MGISILKEPISLVELKEIANERFGDLVKAVVDVRQGILALGVEMHADAEAELIEKEGSRREDVWGINLYPDATGDGFIEFDSLINLKPSLGNRTRNVEDEATRSAIRALVKRLVT